LERAAELIRAYASTYPVLLCQCNGEWKWATLDEAVATVKSADDLVAYADAALLPLDFVDIGGFKTLSVSNHNELVTILADRVLKLPPQVKLQRTQCEQGIRVGLVAYLALTYS
jgi:hypothetical protein